MCIEGESDRCRGFGIFVSAAMSGPRRRHHVADNYGQTTNTWTLKISPIFYFRLGGRGFFFHSFISFQTLFEVLNFKDVCHVVIFCETLDVKESTAVSKLKAVPVTTFNELHRHGCTILREFSSSA